MDVEPGDWAVAAPLRGAWGLWAARKAEGGETGLSVRVPGGHAAFAVRAAEAGKPAFLVAVAGPGGAPAVFRSAGDADGDDDDGEVGGPPCDGPHPLCDRIFCETVLKRVYRVMLSGWPDDCEGGPINGEYALAYTGNCLWVGSGGAWDMELRFYSASAIVSWQFALGVGGVPSGAAYIDYFGPRDPRLGAFRMAMVPCGGMDDASVVVL